MGGGALIEQSPRAATNPAEISARSAERPAAAAAAGEPREALRVSESRQRGRSGGGGGGGGGGESVPAEGTRSVQEESAQAARLHSAPRHFYARLASPRCSAAVHFSSPLFSSLPSFFWRKKWTLLRTVTRETSQEPSFSFLFISSPTNTYKSYVRTRERFGDFHETRRKENVSFFFFFSPPLPKQTSACRQRRESSLHVSSHLRTLTVARTPASTRAVTDRGAV